MPELVNVPNVDGVPAVAFALGSGLGIALAAADAVGLPFPGSQAAQWGIFRNGRPVVTCDNVVAFDHKADWAISDYPVEGGQFESYNKVTVPYDVRLVFTAGGSEQNRADLLNSLRGIVSDFNFYDAVSPEAVYTPVNLVHLDYRRTSQNGVGLLAVSVWCRQVRRVASSTAGAAGGAGATGSDTPSATGGVGETAAPSGAEQTNSGAVQAVDLGTQPNTAATLSQAAPNTTATELTGTNTTATELTGTNVTAVPIEGTNVGQTVQGVPTQNATELSTAPSPAIPQTSSSISGLQAAGPDQYALFGVSP